MADDPKRPDGMPYVAMAFHAALAAAVFFFLNRFFLSQTLGMSALWGAIAAPFAAFLAYQQARR